MKHYICIREADGNLVPIQDLTRRGKKRLVVAPASEESRIRVPLYLSSLPGHNESCFLGAVEIARKDCLDCRHTLEIVFSLEDDLIVSFRPDDGSERQGGVIISAHQLREAKALLVWKLGKYEAEESIDWETP